MAQRQQQQQMLQMQCHEENNGIRKSSILPGNPGSNPAGNGSGSSGVHGPLQNTVFIHKLYNILEDEDLKDLIWWSPSGSSFLIRPTERFSRALATYFKHTNIASFVRQLNMYGFHKVSNDHSKDVQQQTQSGSEATGESIKIWEFRHSMGIFKRGDIEGLKLIKRRSSRNIATLNGRKNSGSAVSLGPVHPQIEESDAAKQQRPQQQPSVPPAPPPPPTPQQQQQQWQAAQQRQPSQFMGNTEEEAQQHPQVGLTAYPSSESVYNQQFQQQHLETRFAELCQSYSGLRYEYSNLQCRHDGLLEQLRVLNVDVAKLLDFVQNLVSLQGANCDLFNEKNFKGDPARLQQFRQHQHEMTALEQEMQIFKTNLMQRFQKNLETLHQQQQYNPTVPQQQPHVLQYSANVLHGHATPPISKDIRPGSSAPANPSAAAAFAPHLFSVPSAPTGAVFQQTGPLISQPEHFSSPRIVMMNPFETTNQTSTVKRTMSILMDPLSSAPNVGGVTVSPSRPMPGTLGSQIPRNPSPLVNSSRPPKQEPPSHTNDSNQQTQVNSHTKRTSRISVKDGTFLLKPNKNSTFNTKRSSVNSDCSSRSDSTTMLPTSGSGFATSNIETFGPRDPSAIGLPFRTFYNHGANSDQVKEDQTKNENPSRLGNYSTLHSAGSFAPPRSTQTSPKQFEFKKPNLETPEPTEPSQQAILSPVPSRSDIQNRRGSSGVYSLLNAEAASARSSPKLDTNPKKKTKL